MSKSFTKHVEWPVHASYIGMTLKELVAEFSGKKFTSKHIKCAGKILKTKGFAEAHKYLNLVPASRGDLKPPVKSLIISKSRDISQWPIFKASKAIQEYIYSLSKKEFESVKPGTSAASHKIWLEHNKIDTFGYLNVQGLNKIFNNAINTYSGVIKRIENKNADEKQYIEYINKIRDNNGDELTEFVEKPIFDETGHLIEKPSVNQSIFCYQGMSPKPISEKDIALLPPEYRTYYRDANYVLPIGKLNRLAIPCGHSGYVPRFMALKTKGRFRFRASAPEDSILYKISIGEDWLIFDGRSLLRNAIYRQLASNNNNITINELLNMFTSDAIIDIERNLVILLYKEGIVPIFARAKPIRGKKTKDIIEETVRKENQIILISCDVGQINPLAVRISVISKQNNKLVPELISQDILPDNLLAELAAYRAAHDQMESKLRSQALNEIEDKYKHEFIEKNNITPEAAKNIICAKLKLNPNKIPWEKINCQTRILARIVKECSGDLSLTTFMKDNKIINRKDIVIKNNLINVSEEARKAFNDKLWEIQKKSPDYNKLTIRKNEFTRRCVNYTIDRAQKFSPGKEIIINLENLTNKNKMHGRGKQKFGWDGLFTPKKENRWVMTLIHAAFLNKGPNRGVKVLLSSSYATSITCPKCDYANSDNRNGEKFVCKKCGYQGNADINVATFNLERVALGAQLLGPQKSKMSNQVRRSARKCKVREMKGENVTAKSVKQTDQAA